MEHVTMMRRYGAVAAIGVILGAALTADAQPSRAKGNILDQTLRDGRRVRELLPQAGTVAVLVFPARTALTCSSDLPFWQQLDGATSKNVIVLISPPIDATDRRSLALGRVRFAAELAEPFEASDIRPHQYLVVDRRVVATRISRDSLRRRIESGRSARR